ncbi:MAG: hypothetical protein H8E44_47050 [Planctomycetes bacterium]|nr:hypothetical protein [Planctomycetota bacterium]
MNLNRRRFHAATLGALGAIGPLALAAEDPDSEDAASRSRDDDESRDPLEQIVDYAASYVTFVTPGRGNLARLQIESRCVLLDENGELVEEFFQFASCKSENTYAAEDLFQDPNYDFSGIFSREHFVIFRAHAPYSDIYAQRDEVRPRFEDLLFQIRAARGVQVLAENPAIVAATLRGLPLVGRTEIHDEVSGARAIIEYPVKTMNVNDLKNIYQVDTGPLAFPDFTVAAERPIDRMELAYVAHNRPDEAYFIVQRPTPIVIDKAEVCDVCHYSDIRHMPAKNTLVSLAIP